jgi:hypothetical protein
MAGFLDWFSGARRCHGTVEVERRFDYRMGDLPDKDWRAVIEGKLEDIAEKFNRLLSAARSERKTVSREAFRGAMERFEETLRAKVRQELVDPESRDGERVLNGAVCDAKARLMLLAFDEVNVDPAEAEKLFETYKKELV